MSTVGELSCENCGVGYGSDDIFCENCGYDFITGSLPSSDEEMTSPVAASAAAPTPAAPTPAGVGASTPDVDPNAPASGPVGPANGGDAAGSARVHISISVDRAYFDAVVSEGELDFPDQPFPKTEIDLVGNEFHVGRTSQSRAIHPDLDIAQLSGDPAVSSRHAVIRVLDDGSVTVTDVGSTNGTFVGEVDSKAIAVGEAVAVADAAAVYVGAWTRLEIAPIEG